MVIGVLRECFCCKGEKKVDLFFVFIGGEIRFKLFLFVFFVFVVLDVLCGLKYGLIMEVMGGEVDGYCVVYVWKLGGLVLILDLDFLVYDFGENGGVIFFIDIDFDLENSKFVVF